MYPHLIRRRKKTFGNVWLVFLSEDDHTFDVSVNVPPANHILLESVKSQPVDDHTFAFSLNSQSVFRYFQCK